MRKSLLFSVLLLVFPALLARAQSFIPYAPFLDTAAPAPLTPVQKLDLAAHNLGDPANIATLADNSIFTVASNPHTACGPGWNGFLRSAGISFRQDATSEFFGTFLIPSVTHQDPRYHRMPSARVPRRIVHAISSTAISQSDNGAPMPNFANLLGYPIDAEIANLYVPDLRTNLPATASRVFAGYAASPIDNLITEFLPTVARHVHVRLILQQRLLN